MIKGEIHEDLVFLKIIGAGAYCKMWLVMNIKTGKFYSAKVININDLDDCMNEIKMYELLSNQYELYINHFKTENYLVIILKLLGSSLETIFKTSVCSNKLADKIYNDIIQILNIFHL